MKKILFLAVFCIFAFASEEKSGEESANPSYFSILSQAGHHAYAP